MYTTTDLCNIGTRLKYWNLKTQRTDMYSQQHIILRLCCPNQLRAERKLAWLWICLYAVDRAVRVLSKFNTSFIEGN